VALQHCLDYLDVSLCLFTRACLECHVGLCATAMAAVVDFEASGGWLLGSCDAKMESENGSVAMSKESKLVRAVFRHPRVWVSTWVSAPVR
jgi:hypothetical protein